MSAVAWNARDLAGLTFGSLTALNRAGGINGKALWLCQCSCGRSVSVRAGHLTSGNTRSCGCLPNPGTTRHGCARRGAKTPEYVTWEGMIRRCHNPAATNYPAYGGAGVKVCAEWRADFASFLGHVGTKPSPDHSLDRVDPFGDYEPGNVRWATRSEQRRNTRRAALIAGEASR